MFIVPVLVLFFLFSFSLFDVRSYVSYKDFYMGKFKDYRGGLGFSVFCIFSTLFFFFRSGVAILDLVVIERKA